MLSRDVEKRARAQGKHCLRWLRKRVERQLRLLGERYKAGAVPFMFVIEESRRLSLRARLHIHGQISIGDVGAEKRSMKSLRRVVAPLRKALERAGGNWVPEFENDRDQLRFAPGTPDVGWAGYSLKKVDKAGAGRRRWVRQFGLEVESDRRSVAQFGGKALTASADLQRKAALKHAEIVKLVWRGR
jgi:hypothetical protein